MRGTGPVSFDNDPTTLTFTEEPGRLRVRLSIDDWDRLGLCEGRRVRLGLPGRETTDVLVAAVRRDPPFVWVEAVALMPAAKAV